MKKDKMMWRGVALGSAALAAMGARSGLRAGWRRWRDEEPPDNPARRGVGWTDALVWAGVMGLAAGVARVTARRLAAGGWERVTGDRPRGL